MRAQSLGCVGAVLIGLAFGVRAQPVQLGMRLCLDQNADGVVTPADYGVFLLNYNAGSLIADVDQNRRVEERDHAFFVSRILSQPLIRCQTQIESGTRVVDPVGPNAGGDYLIQIDRDDDVFISVAPLSNQEILFELESFFGDFLELPVTYLNSWHGQSDLQRVLVNSGSSGGNPYAFTIVVLDEEPDQNSRPLVSGELIQDEVLPGEAHTYETWLDVGDVLLVPVGNEEIYGGSGTYDVFFTTFTAGEAGVYTLLPATARLGPYEFTSIVFDGETIPAGSTLIESGRTYTSELGRHRLVAYRFHAEAGDAFWGTWDSLHSRPKLFTLDGDMIEPDTGFNERPAEWGALPETGEYMLVFRAFVDRGDGEFSAVLPDSGDEPAGAIELVSGRLVESGIGPGQFRVVAFEADAGDDIHLGAMLPDEELEWIRLIAPSGVVVEPTEFDPWWADIAESGRYVAVIGSGSSTVGPFEASVVIADDEPEPDLDIEVVSGRSELLEFDRGLLQTLTFEADAGDDIWINISWNRQMHLYDPFGERITSSRITPPQTEQFSQLDVPIGGRYTLVVANRPTPGTRRVTVVVGDEELDAGDHTELISGQAVADVLERGDLDCYSVVLDAGDDLSLALWKTGDSSRIIELIVYAPDGRRIERTGWVYGAAALLSNVELGGRYNIVVRARDESDNETLPYEIRVDVLP